METNEINFEKKCSNPQEKPHKCALCSKSFPTPGDLKSHMYVHSGSWPFKCHVCSRGFSKHTNLKNHLFLHTGESWFAYFKLKTINLSPYLELSIAKSMNLSVLLNFKDMFVVALADDVTVEENEWTCLRFHLIEAECVVVVVASSFGHLFAFEMQMRSPSPLTDHVIRFSINLFLSNKWFLLIEECF